MCSEIDLFDNRTPLALIVSKEVTRREEYEKSDFAFWDMNFITDSFRASKYKFRIKNRNSVMSKTGRRSLPICMVPKFLFFTDNFAIVIL